MVFFGDQKENVENIFMWDGMDVKNLQEWKEESPRWNPFREADDESKNRYLAKLTRVQCRLRMQKMVELSGSLGVGRRVQRKEARGNAE